MSHVFCWYLFLINVATYTSIYTLSLHDALPISVISIQIRTLHILDQTTFMLNLISGPLICLGLAVLLRLFYTKRGKRSEEHTSELQSHHDLVCRLLLEKKKIINSSFRLRTFVGK